ncbi:hypothetical protein BN134_607 [Cronobacter dublinensis 1210]|uniref:Uncharacterized protein n=1 Tax=Cronobacter dublinensis 1210 TaxID=1208656 RepID=A0ABP1W4Q4_9ENTR|nr:hypothetical protein BN134_607 [Cronobacter dublinensis 1210]
MWGCHLIFLFNLLSRRVAAAPYPACILCSLSLWRGLG